MTFIIRPDLDEEQTQAVIDQVRSRITAAGGEVIAYYAWNPARRRMAYPIRDFGDGYYVTATFRLDPQTVRQVENPLRLNDRILRFLVVLATDQNIRQSQQRMQQAASTAAPAPAAAAVPAGVAETVPTPAVPGSEAGPEEPRLEPLATVTTNVSPAEAEE
jgi:small subunit ribosomal protein S6